MTSQSATQSPSQKAVSFPFGPMTGPGRLPIDLDDDAIDELLDDDDDFGEGDLNDLDEPDDDYEDEL